MKRSVLEPVNDEIELFALIVVEHDKIVSIAPEPSDEDRRDNVHVGPFGVLRTLAVIDDADNADRRRAGFRPMARAFP